MLGSSGGSQADLDGDSGARGQETADSSLSKGLELASVIHDVNQMLAVVVGRAGLLLNREPGDDWRQNLRAIELAARDAGAILGRINDGALQSGSHQTVQGNLFKAVTDSGVLIFPCGPGACNTTAASGGNLEVDIPDHLFVRLPEQIIREVLNNLMLNSLEATPDGVEIRVSVITRDNRALLSVADNGPGIADANRVNLFEPGSSSSGIIGRGMGLAGCRNLLLQWDGELRLIESGESGTVFELDLPIARPSLDSGEKNHCPSDESDTCASKENYSGSVLIVDDEPAVREMLGDVMTELGYHVQKAGNADQAREIFVPGAFDVVILDQSLPGMQGDELAGLLRKKDPGVAITLATGWGKEKLLAEVCRENVDFTTIKPMEMLKIKKLMSEGVALASRRRSVTFGE